MSEWHPASSEPHIRLFTDDPDFPGRKEGRFLVVIAGIKEAQKASQLIRENGKRRWRIDGFLGDWTITHWMPLPAPPPYTEV